MKCQDISLILDDRDARALAPAERHAVDAHLAICPDCARDWQVHTGLVAALVPAVPAELPGRIRAMLAAQPARTRDWRWPARVLLMGGLFAAGAAAALLVDRLVAPELAATTLSPSPSPSASIAAPAQVAAPATGTPTATAPDRSSMPSGPTPSRPRIAQEGSGSGAAAVASPIRVLVMPLLNQATGEAVAAVDAEYAAFIEGMRVVPGVTLILPAAGASEAEPADFRLTVRGVGPLSDGKFRIHLDAAMSEAGGAYRSMVSTWAAGDTACPGPSAAGLPATCVRPQQVAAQHVLFVRTTVLVPGALGPLNPADTRSRILPTAASANPRSRASAWRTARGIGAPEFVEPLIAALLRDSDASVRAWAASTLAADFGELPEARAALDTAARGDASPLVRAFVQHALTGGDTWKNYIIESLQDTRRSTADRLEAITFAMEQPTGSPPDIDGLLRSNEVIEPLARLISGMESWPRDNRMMLLLTRVGMTQHPAAVNLLVDNLGRYQELMSTGVNVIYLLSLHGSDPRVRAGLEKISRDDPDPYVRRNAAEALQKIAAGTVRLPAR